MPIEFATIPHKMPVRPAGLNTIGSGVSLPAGRGLAGGAPGAAVRNVILRGSDVRVLFASGRVPLSAQEVSCREEDVLAAKSFTFIDEGDLLIGVLAGGAGFGDPVRREPASVVRDVREGLVSVEMAGSLYGGVLAGSDVDEAGTRAAREAIRAERLAGASALGGRQADGRQVDGGVVLHPVLDTLEAVEVDGARRLRCTVCRRDFGDYGDDPKRTAVMRELPLVAISPHNRLCLPEFLVREFSCPGCGTAMASDVQRHGDPILDELRLVRPGIAEPAG